MNALALKIKNLFFDGEKILVAKIKLTAVELYNKLD